MEKWREFYTDEQLKKVQTLELMILDELDRVCRELDISFFMYGGSLIGAVKFNGFVPWDDDIDVALHRDDYMKLARKGAGVLSDRFVLQSPYDDNRSPYPYLKIRLRNTFFAEYGFHKLPTEHGIYIDVYPIDRVPKDREEYLKSFDRFHKLASLYSRSRCPYVSDPRSGLKNRLKKIAKRIAWLFLAPARSRSLIKKMDRIACRKDADGAYGNYYHATPVNLFSDIKPYEPSVFEGREINLPRDWDGFLRLRYGNYEDMPEESKRVGHRPYIIDFGPYDDKQPGTNPNPL